MLKRLFRLSLVYGSFVFVFCRDAMPQFRWPEVANDILLAREVIGRRPSKPADWDVIAGILSSVFSKPGKLVCLKGRGCRERLDRLVEKYRTDDTQSLKRFVECNTLFCYKYYELIV